MMLVKKGLAVSILAAVACAAAGMARSEPPARTVEVAGEGVVRAAPDEVSFSLGIRREGRDPKSARADMAKSARKVLAELTRFGVEEKDVQTAQASISPQYRNTGGEQVLIGYRSATTVTVKMRKIEDYDVALGACLDAGANELEGVVFSSSRQKFLAGEARRKAMEDARERALLLAQSGGANLGRLLSVRESSFRAQPPVRFGHAGMLGEQAGAAGPSLAGGEIEVTATVQAIWELKD